MSLGNTTLALDLLNGATTWVADVDGTTGGSHQLVVNGVYEVQALVADTYVGFGPNSASAITDGDEDHGVLLVQNAVPRIYEVTSPAVLFIGCNGGTLRIRRSAQPT